MSKPSAAPIHPLVLMQVEARLTEEQKAIQNVVRDFAARELKPNIAAWYEDGQLPARDLAKALGGIGILGMHLKKLWLRRNRCNVLWPCLYGIRSG